MMATISMRQLLENGEHFGNRMKLLGTSDMYETFLDEEEAYACQRLHKGAEITSHPGHGIMMGGNLVYDIPENRPSWTVYWYEPNADDEHYITFDPADCDGMRKLIAEYSNSETPFFGRNKVGEDIMIDIFQDKIIITTYQNDGQIRVNEYSPDAVGKESFEGKWLLDGMSKESCD